MMMESLGTVARVCASSQLIIFSGSFCFSETLPGNMPGTSAKWMSGILKESQRQMKLAAFSQDCTEGAPASKNGLLAMKPTTLPAILARQVISDLPNSAFSSKYLPSSTIRLITRCIS